MKKKAPVANLLALCTGLLFLVLVEGVLQVFDLGPSPRLFVLAESENIYIANRDATYRFFQRQYQRHSPLDLSFAASKSPDVVRVFTLGASTLVGFPHPVSAAFPHFLEKMLPAAYPDRRFEVINCGITALNTFCLVDFMRELADYEPDLVVVYAGHNEFMGPYGVTTPFVRFGNDRALIQLYMLLQHSRLYYYLGEFIAWLEVRKQPDEEEKSFGLHLVQEEIGLLDPGYEKTAENYRANLEEIAAIAAERGISLLFSTLVSNLKDFHPLRSECDEWTPTLAEVAEDQIGTALREKSYCANLHFELGRRYYLRGQYDRAKVAFEQARDMDRLPFRAPTLFNHIIREVTADSETALICDVEAVFAAASPHGIVGSELVSDYVHPTIYGHYLIARAMIETLEASPLAGEWGARGTLGGYADYRSDYPLLAEVWRRNDLMLFLKRMPYRVSPASLSRRLAELIETQLVAISQLASFERNYFVERGGLRFLKRMLKVLEPTDQQHLQRTLEEVGGVF
ncbi:MAG: hypothetical protein VX293_00810 [Candidatus Latescibacterota bacterium]|nr:hypothetical protein [Candidatus Latescibacterota bacterium]